MRGSMRIAEASLVWCAVTFMGNHEDHKSFVILVILVNFVMKPSARDRNRLWKFERSSG